MVPEIFNFCAHAHTTHFKGFSRSNDQRLSSEKFVLNFEVPEYDMKLNQALMKSFEN